ncbi:MAG: serine protease Do [Limisphaerales bacterium]|jgi:serine protease Do
MSIRALYGAILIFGTVAFAAADEIRLKEAASISGRILSEKTDRVYVDIGYTVLDIPRKAIVKISRGNEKSPTSVAPKPEKKGFYYAGGGRTEDGSVRDLVLEIGSAVVQVKSPGGTGSGFFINQDGDLITNFHVIEGESRITIEVYHVRDGRLERKSYPDVKIVAMNKFDDLALLRIDQAAREKFQAVPLAVAKELKVGERVFAIGSPLGLERTVTEGIISTANRQMSGSLYLQTTAQINPGNSGGPLFNMRGEVVGVTNMKITFGEGLGFAIPVEKVKYFLDHSDAFAYDNDNPQNGYHYLSPPSLAKAALEKAEKARIARAKRQK